MKFAYGQPVEINPDYKFARDWLGQKLWIAGITWDGSASDPNIWVSERWPPWNNGDITDGFREQHLQAREEA